MNFHNQDPSLFQGNNKSSASRPLCVCWYKDVLSENKGEGVVVLPVMTTFLQKQKIQLHRGASYTESI